MLRSRHLDLDVKPRPLPVQEVDFPARAHFALAGRDCREVVQAKTFGGGSDGAAQGVVQRIGGALRIREVEIDALGQALLAKQRAHGAAALQNEAAAFLQEDLPDQALDELLANGGHDGRMIKCFVPER